MNAVLPRVMIAFEPPSSGLGAELLARGHETVAVEDRDQIDETIAGQPFELCIVWVDTPEALELCGEVRRTPRGAVTPILIVGGEGMAVEDLDAAVDAGADAFVERDAGTAELLARVDGLLGYSGEDEPRDAAAAPDPVEEALSAAEAVGEAAEALPSVADRGSIPPGQASLSELIDQVEQELAPSLEPDPTGAPDVPEDLDALDIEADLGRPAPLDEDPVSIPLSEPPEAPDAEDPSPETDASPAPPGLEDAEPARSGEEGSAALGEPVDERTSGGDDRGSLAEERLWSLLARALAMRFTGVLVIAHRDVERRLYLEDGEPLLAVSSAREDRLIELLFREGRLSEEQYQRASLTVSESGRRVGVVLVERGLIASRELFPLVRHHYEMLIFDSFAWREGEFRFEEGERSRGERILLDVPGAALIVEGLRSRARLEDVDALVSATACPLRLDSGIRPLEEVGLAPFEQRLVEDCDGTNTVGDLARLHDVPELELRTLLAGLVVLGWIEAEGGSGGGERRPAPGLPAPRHDQDARVERARVADKLTQVDEATYFSLMEVPPDASGHEIRKAYRRLRGQFALERFAVADLVDLREQVEVIRLILDEAYEILRDPALREAYRQALEDRP
jgi:hypothetical protein